MSCCLPKYFYYNVESGLVKRIVHDHTGDTSALLMFVHTFAYRARNKLLIITWMDVLVLTDDGKCTKVEFHKFISTLRYTKLLYSGSF